MTTGPDAEIYCSMIDALEELEKCREFASLIPEVRTNLVFARKDAKEPGDVLAVDGRITVLDGMPYAAGKLKFGASSHMARLIIELKKRFPSIRSGMNFRSNPGLVKWLKSYCREKGWNFGKIDRSMEPERVKEKECASMPWKVGEALRSTGGKLPRIFYETGAVGKEEVAVLVGEDPVRVVRDMCDIARHVGAESPAEPKVGKIDLDVFTSFILKRLGKKDKSILVPPLTGVDSGVIDIGNNKVLVVAEDPIFSIPKQSPEMFGWYTVHIGASDVAVMGVKPRYMTYTLLMPPETENDILKRIVDSIHKTALELEISIVGGHTGFYPGFASPTIGGIAVFAIADKDAYVTPCGAREGDDVILTKGPAIESVGILSVLREKELAGKYAASLIKKAKSVCMQMTVVKDALTAMETGGVTAMHDATEGGVLGALYEIANASRVGMEIEEEKFIYPAEVRMVCEAFKLDPVTAIAEGSLLITAKHEYSGKIVKNLKKAGINSSVIGRVIRNTKKRILRRRNGETINLEIPAQDPFWPVFFEGVERGD